MDNKYNEFIENYLFNDKTKSAIMLIGGWGTGKSYYIQNVLKPYLENKKADCCIVSLYGLNDLKDISKAIYFEVRTKKLDEKIAKIKGLEKTESQAGAKIIGKTIVKSVAGLLNIDLSGNEDDFQKLYESINLYGKLIILEDLERSNIPIKDVLGYVNNLVEQDGIKVLLVANENEILKSEVVVVGKDKNGDEIKEWQWTTETREYLKTKEKTISDTIPYVCDYFETIENIINQFKSKSLEVLLVDKFNVNEKTDFIKESEMEKILKIQQQTLYLEIISIAEDICGLNLRSFIFACQKTVDILRYYNKEIDKTFVKNMFMSIVAFSFRLKANDKLFWSDKENGYSLGTRNYPLYEFAHDYIKYQILDVKKIEDEEKMFLAQKLADNVQNDVIYNLNILYDFYFTTSTKLESAICEIKKYLGENVLDFIIYGKLANYLVIVRNLIDTPCIIDDCKKKMLENLENGSYDSSKVNDSLSFHDSFRFWTIEQENEFNEFISELKSTVKNKRNSELKFDYSIGSVDSFINEITENRNDYINQHTFLKRVDISKLIYVIRQCTSQQIDKFRRAIFSIYSLSNIDEFFVNDEEALRQLKDSIVMLLSSKDYDGDKIKRLQLSWFVDNLNSILDKFD